VTIEDVQKAREQLDLTMGKLVEPRREWIFQEYDKVDLAELDI
jgi:DNA gyrase/topoisomerase IV subunit B